MTSLAPQPTRIDSFSPTEMLLAWNTQESFAVPYTEVRFECPCANCVDEHTGARILQREQIPAGIKPTGAQVVGRYAVALLWNDGHSTGIYHFDRLYELCRRAGRAV